MDVILLERVEKLGQIGDVVNVKDGFARNFLLPQKKALRATEGNKKVFENQRADIEARNLEAKKEAEAVAEKLEGQTYTLIRQASDMGQLYGSVSSRDIAEAAEADGFHVSRSQIVLDKPLKNLGVSDVRVVLHPEVSINIAVNIARSQEEAEAQARGENVLGQKEELDEDLIRGTGGDDFFEEGADAPEATAEGEPAPESDADRTDS
ncbi:50S ribosomal protein L9 [Parvularcula sp. IMCC14364]|uniref:50S ribosomal protein L9 n=1 Tax=Parvularcula sp. IMCC14364 TaxID=3067902 RepID=UPI0027428BD8|nr:50S ribosomal protein L9 [Parvularcula sp. IMCC14364]